VGNLHLRFDEGRAGRATRVAFSPTLPPLPGYSARREEHALPIVRDEFRPDSSIGVVATRARLRFTGILRIVLWRFGAPEFIIERQVVS
jgi:hypothetical protein